MLTLALDTAGVDRTTVALIDDRGVRAGASMSASPAEQLLPMISALLAQESLTPSDISRVVVGVGPGPFTGLRIGLAHAHAMAHALGIPVLGVSSLAAVAAAHAEQSATHFVVATDARRKEVYCAVVSDGDVVPDTVAVMAPADAAARYPGLL
ncbi:MAG: tRNA (adenosine(37)-N6)-threonylcarbamoyltransferase complex dimerization subunit type 1 TsaB, partial [Actinobacteria bacterium]|nr:tRNA (adenosine(37)-N6)-threonylcarbamoyltransferase complex dimerization subunit type 1 TsaB [Actinomycetota bacterium]